MLLGRAGLLTIVDQQFWNVRLSAIADRRRLKVRREHQSHGFAVVSHGGMWLRRRDQGTTMKPQAARCTCSAVAGCRSRCGGSGRHDGLAAVPWTACSSAFRSKAGMRRPGLTLAHGTTVQCGVIPNPGLDASASQRPDIRVMTKAGNHFLSSHSHIGLYSSASPVVRLAVSLPCSAGLRHRAGPGGSRRPAVSGSASGRSSGAGAGSALQWR